MKKIPKTLLLRWLVVALIVLCCSESHAQVHPRFRNQFKLSVFRLLNPGTPGLELSYERSFMEPLSVQASYTYILPVPILVEQSGFRASIEPKYFFFSKRAVRMYTSLQYEYHQSQFLDSMYFLTSEYNESQPYLDHYAGNRELHYLNARWGLQIHGGHFIFEFSAGLGIKHRSVVHLNRQNKSDFYYNKRGFKRALTQEGKYNKLAIPISLKLGYQF